LLVKLVEVTRHFLISGEILIAKLFSRPAACLTFWCIYLICTKV
jgi:hypothetical protein